MFKILCSCAPPSPAWRQKKEENQASSSAAGEKCFLKKGHFPSFCAI